MRSTAFFTLPLLAATLGGCATALPPIEATRFHRVDSPAIAPGTYVFVAQGNAAGDAAGDAGSGLASRGYEIAVARQLDRLGLRNGGAAASDQADYQVSLRVSRDRGPADASANGTGVSVGVGGGTGGYHSGVGVGVGLDLTRLLADRRDVVTTRLAVQITRRGDSLPLWEGRAQSVARAGSPAAQADLDADKLATALFRDFPGRSGETITVP
ncbi:DUF4136 domain-containing protein [Sphingomonas lacunae]|uniref:DUF4136 domain-containing protein n=1 Tax=Sphingomonas lacunae TaxID=2698828 RepID=A0A6M4AS71_9SPHN|nr:DUF4136 domain-containing protein [Sphingomonas lacunae]QJQ31918.1 DUF4136 domain-containing protein [Sphingomonas lacunae]